MTIARTSIPFLSNETCYATTNSFLIFWTACSKNTLSRVGITELNCLSPHEELFSTVKYLVFWKFWSLVAERCLVPLGEETPLLILPEKEDGFLCFVTGRRRLWDILVFIHFWCKVVNQVFGFLETVFRFLLAFMNEWP